MTTIRAAGAVDSQPIARRFMLAALAFVLVAPLVPAPAAAQTQTIKVAISQRNFWNSSFVDFGQRESFFKQEGLEVEAFYTDGGAATLDAVMSGSVDIAMANGILGAISRYTKGAPLRVVTAETTGANDAFWYARADSGIKTLKDAKTVAFSSPGSSTNLMVLALLKQTGSGAKPLATGGAPATLTQVMTKQVDVGWSVPPFALAQIDDGQAAIVARGSDIAELAGQTVRVNVTREDILKQKRDLLTRFLRAYARSIDFAYDSDKALGYYAETNKISAAIAKQTREFYPKEMLQMGEIKGLDLTLRDALAFKYIGKAMEPKDIAGLFDILQKN